MRSVTPTTSGLPVDIVKVTRIFLVICLHVARLGVNVPTVHLAVVLVVIGNEAPYVRVNTVSVGHRAVVGVVFYTLAIIAAIKYWTLKRGVGGIGNLAVGALARSGGARSGAKGALASIQLHASRTYPMSRSRAFFAGEPGHGEMELWESVVQ